VKLRATTRRDSLTLVPSKVTSVHGGPMACMARAATRPGVSIADLSFGDNGSKDEDEAGDETVEDSVVEVRFIVNDAPAARRVLKRWAANVGHRRIWFRDEVADLEPPDGLDQEFGATCPTCGFEIIDSGPELMKFVHRVGYFPTHCFICGSFIPQWERVNDEAADHRTDSGRRRGRGSEHGLRVVDV
jgi:hypothetical protein